MISTTASTPAQGGTALDRRPGTNGSTGEGAVSRRGNAEASRPSSRANPEEQALLPPVDVIEDSTGITLYADLPGVPKDRLEVRVDADTLIIEGELGLPTPQGMAASHAEIQVTRYRRTFTLSKELDAAKVDAEFHHGVLRVRIPKASDAQPRRIAIRVN